MPPSSVHPALTDANYIYPQHYREGRLDCPVRIAFEPAVGRPLSGNGMKVTAGTRGTWVLNFTNDARPLPTGSVVAFLRFNCQFYGRLQTDNPSGRDYGTLEVESEAALELVGGPSTQALARVLVRDGVFAVGDRFTVRLGDRRRGGAGSEVFWTVTQGRLLTAVDPTGDGEFSGVRDNPFEFEVVAHSRPDGLQLLGPTVVDVGEKFALHLCVHDQNRNPVDSFTGAVEFLCPAGIMGLPAACTFTDEDKGVKVFEGVSATSVGVHRIGVRSAECPGLFFSNPVVAQRKPSRRIFWGDPHSHGWGDSTMFLMTLRTGKVDPLARHEQARRYGRYDWSAPGAMSLPPDVREEVWKAWREACKAVDEPGGYVPFLSYEAHPREGDRNVIFRHLDEPPPPPFRVPMAQLEKVYGGRDDVFLEVHIGGAPPKWDDYRPERERMVEAVSGFGNAEWLLQQALQRGYRPTVVGASDLHLGWLGTPRAVEPFRGRAGYVFPMSQRDSGYGSGPATAVFAPELTRDALWEAMSRGATYATTGARIHVDFRINDAAPGTTVNIEDGALFSLECHGCQPIERLDLIVGRYCLRTWNPYELDVVFEEGLPAEDVPGDWAYVRILQPDAEYAWSNVVYLRGAAGEKAAGDLPLWNAPEPFDLAAVEENEASRFLPDLQRYLETEEDPSMFHDLTPIGVFTESMGTCALFFCHYGPQRRRMQIRWYYAFEMPRIRYDFGWRDFGMVDELTDL